ncbi:MAG: hypothetical protein CMI55_03795 [Parcubacteria group bacterium]|jgi:transcriptional regulator with XRE-family HTH domain|nr:hypothetical protein [Parcubacteria group bacterium]|tara:strand:+ start:6368 stop:7051 length:684 start_codon:yes stop_codon:yes gene_type:complete
MAKFKEKIKARGLRQKGQSIKEIAKKLKVSKSSVSIWCRDIQLTRNQIALLDEKQLKGGYKGRIKGAKIQRKKYLKKVKELEKEGFDQIKKLSRKDILIAGIALYWGEGNRKWHISGFGNSDPKMIKFIIFWFKNILNIDKKRLSLHVGINQIHKNRVKKVEKYWSRITNIPENQFTKVTLRKVKNKKIYKNHDNYYGTLHIRIRKSSDLQHKIHGLINALAQRKKY